MNQREDKAFVGIINGLLICVPIWTVVILGIARWWAM